MNRHTKFAMKSNFIFSKAYDEKPYPTLEEKRKLAEKTNLTITQVSNWFKNKRQRIRMTKQRERFVLCGSNSFIFHGHHEG